MSALPKEYIRGIIVPLQKGKGIAGDHQNYKGYIAAFSYKTSQTRLPKEKHT